MESISCPGVNSTLPCLTTGEQVLDTLAFEKVGLESRLVQFKYTSLFSDQFCKRYRDVDRVGCGVQDSGIYSSPHEDKEEIIELQHWIFLPYCPRHLLFVIRLQL